MSNGPSQFAAVGADGFPSNVASGELVESAWGNAVVSKLRSGYCVYSQSLNSSYTNNAVGVTDVLTWGPAGTYPFATICSAQAIVWFGAGAVAINASADVLRLDLGTLLVSSPSPVQTPVGAYTAIPFAFTWPVAANQSVRCKTRINVLGMASGTCSVLGFGSMTITLQ